MKIVSLIKIFDLVKERKNSMEFVWIGPSIEPLQFHRFFFSFGPTESKYTYFGMSE